jgi:hypothetical protein
MAVDGTRSRQVLGGMNDFAVAAELFLRDDKAPSRRLRIPAIVNTQIGRS